MPKQPKPKQVPKAVLRIVDRVKAGEVLCREPGPKGGDPRFWFEPSQKPAPVISCNRAIQAGLLVENNDGLFAGFSQTFSAA